MTRPTTFVVLTTQRSGSSWLVDLLNSHPDVVAYPEMFRVTDTTFSSYGASDVPRFEVFVGPCAWSTSKWLVRRRFRYVRALARTHPDARAVGFKLMYDQTRDHPGLLTGLVLARAKFVHLVRRDYLSGIVSYDVAERLDRWSYGEHHAVTRVRVRIAPDDLLRRLEERQRTIDRFRRKLVRLPARVLEITYEDLVDRRDETLQKVLRFLGVERIQASTRSSLTRSGSTHVSDTLENYDEVRDALIGTRFEALAR